MIINWCLEWNIINYNYKYNNVKLYKANKNNLILLNNTILILVKVKMCISIYYI